MIGTYSRSLYPVVFEIDPIHAEIPRGRERNRFLGTAARQAVLKSARMSGLTFAEFPKTQTGAPKPVKGYHWSLSHKPGMVAGLIDRYPVGIDVEIIRPISRKMFDKIASPNEWNHISGDPLKAFFRCWTAKEAVLKAFGVGLSGLSDCHLDSDSGEEEMSLRYHGRICRVVHRMFGNAVAAVFAEAGADIEWIRITGWRPCNNDTG